MSSILKSLRKIEEQKRGSVPVAPDLLSDQGFTPAQSKPFLALLTGLALGALMVGLFFFWSSEKQPTAEVANVDSNSVDRAQTLPVETVAPPVSSVLPAGVSLLVTEIFFNEDELNSMAVVNDLPVMIGTHVDSAIVTGIHPDRVIFELDNQTYTMFVISQ